MTELRFLALSDMPDGSFGGKAQGLGRLCQTGLSVPDGFAVSATQAPTSAWDPEAKDTFLQRCQQLRGNGRLAIRSSALGEDAADRSFAGLFETVLGVTSDEEALAAADRCIRSGGAPRVLTYAQRQEPIPVGLVVQRLVEGGPTGGPVSSLVGLVALSRDACPGTSGVVFSRDPAGRDPAVVVEAVRGRGEALVSGQVTPEAWRIYRTGFGDWELRRTNPAALAEGLTRLERVPLDRPLAKPGVLTPARALELAETAQRVAGAWGEAVDMEWAVDAQGQLWWLQARPITTGSAWRLPVVRRSSVGEDDGPISVWSNLNVRESMPDPFHPLSWSVLKSTVVPAVMRAMTGIPERSPCFPAASGVDLINGRIYFNLNAFIGAPILGFLLKRAMHHLDVQTGVEVNDLLDRRVLRPRRNPGAFWAVIWGMITRPLEPSRHVPGVFQPRAWLTALEASAAQLRQRPPVSSLSDQALCEELLVLNHPEVEVIRRGLEEANMAFYIWLAAGKLFAPWPEALRLLPTGVKGNPTTAISLGVDALVQAARTLPVSFEGLEPGALLQALRASEAPSVKDWLAELDRFLAQVGHRAPREFDLATPRWADDPRMIVSLVQEGLKSPAGESLHERLERLASAREARVAEAIQAAPFWRRPLMRWVSRAVLDWMPLREAPKHYAMLAHQRARHAALELGRRLVSRGELKQVEDIHFLELEELRGILAGQPVGPEVVDARRADLERWQRMTPETLIRSDGVPSLEEEVLPDGELAGHGIGGGVGEGRVNLLEEPDPRLVQEGDVLVVTYADPGWTPLFARASAVVMEVGGLMCHAAVVARELGIPAVFAVRGARSRLRPGERVRVDGNAGRVIRLEAGHEH